MWRTQLATVPGRGQGPDGDRDRGPDTRRRRTVHARLIDGRGPHRQGLRRLAEGRSRRSSPGIKHVALDPFRGYANAIREELPDANAVLDAFHIVKLDTRPSIRSAAASSRNPGRRGHKDDPLYKIRRLPVGAATPQRRQIASSTPSSPPATPATRSASPGSPTNRCGPCTRPPRPPRASGSPSRSSPRSTQCPIPEITRLGRTLRMWREHVLARFETHRISNGGTEAVNLIIEKTRRLAHGFRTFDHYRRRVLLAASGLRPYRRATHAKFRRP